MYDDKTGYRYRYRYARRPPADDVMARGDGTMSYLSASCSRASGGQIGVFCGWGAIMFNIPGGQAGDVYPL